MPLTTIDGAKSAAVSFQPLLLAEWTFYDGTVLRASTHPLKVSDGGVQYAGNDYLGRILNQDIGQVQALSEQGIDVVPTVTIHLADADKAIWLNYEQAHGFKGATLDLVFVFYDLQNGTFSSDSLKRFTGVCDAPKQVDDRTLAVTASSLINVRRRQFPIMPIQHRCPLVNPRTAEQRAEANNEDSIFYECGEARDLGTAPPCKYTNETCTQPTRRANITFNPPEGGRSREYVSGQWVNIRNSGNDAKYGEYFPMVYGTAWVAPPVMNVIGDGNSTRGEVVVCMGEVEDVLRVIVNDLDVPAATSMTHTPYLVQDPLFRWNLINRGDRDGSPNTDSPYNGQGDPYGSLCALMFVVPRKVAEASSTPNVRVLVRGPKIRVYTDATTYTKQYTENPVWILLDLLIWTNFTYSQIDMASFVAAAAICDEMIDYVDQNGQTQQHPRYRCSLALRERRPAADILLAVRNSCNAVLIPNSTDGKLKILIRQTIAGQQPSPISGANNNTAIGSKLLDGTSANGYAAWHFSPGNILRDQSGRSTLRLWQEPIANTPNRVTFNFSDDTLQHAASSFSVVDSEDVARSQQEVAAPIQVEGIPNYDQAARVGNQFLAERLRGNTEGDTRGTWWFECECSSSVVKVHVGQICILESPEHDLNVHVRVTRVQPNLNFETCKISGHFHYDDWYTDAYGQQPYPRYKGIRRDRLMRPSFPWAPYFVQPSTADSMHERTRWTFGLTPKLELLADASILTKLEITGKLAVNDFAALSAPLVQAQGLTANTGGTVAGGGWLYWMAVCAKDADGKLSAPSALCRVAVTDSGSANTITVPILSWDDDTSGWAVFAGKSPNSLTFQDEGTGTPDSITIEAFSEATWGIPDGEFDKIRVKVKRVAHSGLFGAIVTALTGTTVTIGGASWSAGQWVGYDLSLLCNNEQTALELFNRAITANTSNTLTVANTTGLSVGDVVTIRSKPVLSNGNRTLTDARWMNNLSNDGNGLDPDDEIGRLVRIVSGAGRGQVRRIESATATSVTVDRDWDGPLDATSRYIIEEPNWLPDTAVYEPGNNWDPAAQATLSVSVDNYRGQVLLVQPFTVDGGGNEAVDSLSPFREIYIPGTPPGLVTVTSDYTVSRADRTVLVDTTAGPVTVTLLPGIELKGLNLMVKLITNGSEDDTPGNDCTVTAIAGEEIEGVSSMVLNKKGQFVEVVGVQ